MQSESLQQLLFSVHCSRQSLIPCLNSGDVIHIHGHPASGKTHLLYFLLATCTLSIGWDKAAIVFDMDGKFSISRFEQLLVSRLKPSLSSEAIARTIERCLKRMHIFRPTSSDQLAVTLAHLPKYHAKHFPDIALGMLAIHSIDAFYWLDRFKAEQLRSAMPYGSLQNPFSVLETVRLSLGSVVVLTDWLLHHRQASVSKYAYDTHLENNRPNPTHLPLIHQITLSVIDTNSGDPEDRHVSGVINIPGGLETRNFTLRIRPNDPSVDIE